MTEILKEAERIDAEEDAQHGQARGDELPEQLRTRGARRAALKDEPSRLALQLIRSRTEEQLASLVELPLKAGRIGCELQQADALVPAPHRHQLVAKRERFLLPLR